MPNYHYLCKICDDEFEVYQSIHEDSLIHCNKCDLDGLERVIYAVEVAVKKEPKTLGLLADRNRQKMSAAQRAEKDREIKQKQKFSKQALHGGELTEKSEYRPFWRPDSPSPDVALASYTDREKEKFIMEGKRAIGK